MRTDEIETKIKKLPDAAIAEANDYIDFLISKYGNRTSKHPAFRFDWEGGLEKMRASFTSVQLQHKSLEWR
jgi:hypothetical protein